jgi:hypothetical protein
MSICHEKIDQINFADSDECLNVQARQTFIAPDESNSEGGCIGVENSDSATSEGTIAGSFMTPMSMNESGDDSPEQCTGPATPRQPTYVYQLPQGYMQLDGSSQVYQQFLNGQQFHQGFNIYSASRGESVGYTPGLLQPMPMNTPFPQPSYHQQVYPIRQSQPPPQNWVRMVPPNNAVPLMTCPGSYPKQHYQAQQTSIEASSMVSTPVFSRYSSPGYPNTYSCINTPVISPVSCTPNPYYMAYPDVPPRLDLVNNNLQSCTLPQKFSCKISKGSRSLLETSASTSETPNKSMKNKPMNSTNAFHMNERPLKNLWWGNLSYDEYNYNGGSNLFITWSGSKADLIKKFRSFNLDIRDVLSTSDDKICNVIFETHPIARKAFTMQNQIRLQIVPPKNSHRIWLRNPSPKFLVEFETKRRLTVRKGRAECHEIVGEILQGCLITVDQLKGHRIRVVSCEGSFMLLGGKIVEMIGVPDKSDQKTPLGWISYRCKYTKELNVVRRSWNCLEDYIYEG